jgi:hypothetical protein
MKWTPEHIIGGGVMGALIILIALGIDAEVKSMLALAIGWVFRSLYMAGRQNKGGN